MRVNKDELIHLHTLMNEVEAFLTETGVEVETPEYDDKNVQPIHIHKPKKDHASAVLTLASEITASLPETETATETPETVTA